MGSVDFTLKMRNPAEGEDGLRITLKEIMQGDLASGPGMPGESGMVAFLGLSLDGKSSTMILESLSESYESHQLTTEKEAEMEKAKLEFNGLEEDDVMICHKCKTLVDEADLREDEPSGMGETSIMSKMHCSSCGYIDLPAGVSREEYQRYREKPQRKVIR